MSPEGSSIHSEQNMFYVIEHELANMKIKCPHHKFLIGGDFNAYTKQESEFIQFDSMSYINDDIEYAEDILPATRYSLDNHETNAYGDALLDLCITCSFRILNDRFGKDENIGNFTCITENSASIIDYFVADFSSLEQFISDFEVHDRIESILMPFQVQLKMSNYDHAVTNEHEPLESENILLYINEPTLNRSIFNEDQSQDYIRSLLEKKRKYADRYH